ncbi:MAG: phosphodiester glycosidase family protein [Akkermansiaceae bacterium]|nr:phosphodiester glycosidase family protein [Armatimonadota bacterium]
MRKPYQARRNRTRLVVLSLLVTTVVAVWRCYFAQPPATTESLYPGVRYERRVWRKPRPVTLHLLVIDTRTPGLRFLVTPPDNPGTDRPLVARTTSEFLRERGLQVAINADFFYPWNSDGPFDHYPHRRDPVTVEGDAVSEGVRYATRDAKWLETLYLSRDNRPSLAPPKGGVPWNAVGGHALLRNGVAQTGSAYDKTVADPRTAVGFSPGGDTLYFVCVDGRQPGYSDGMTLVELAGFFRSLGVRDAINLDGGGSTTLVVADGKRRSRVLNRPIDQRFPGKERYVANHLGLYAMPLTTEGNNRR